MKKILLLTTVTALLSSCGIYTLKSATIIQYTIKGRFMSR